MKVRFDYNCPNWRPYLEDNIMFLRITENFLNDLLKVRGYVTIMDVYDHLGLEHDFEHWNDKKLKDLCWRYENDSEINFSMDIPEGMNVIYLDFNIDID